MKRIQMTMLFLCVISCLSGNFLIASAIPAGQPGMGKPMPQMNPEDLKMLQEVEQEINKFVGSLPPEEQKKFWNEVDELSKVMSTMSEEELVKFMETAMQEQESLARPPMPTPTPYPIEQAPLPVIEKPTTPALPTVVESPEKQNRAHKVIEAIIMLLNNFMTKVQALPEIGGKVQSWVKEGKVRGAKGDWNVLRSSIESFASQLNKMKDQDPSTGKFKYLDEVGKDEGLMANLQRLKDTLTKFEPQIEISPFGIERMNHKTREAVRAVLNSLIEATTIMGIPASFAKIVEKYEPMAKQLREKEEAAQKQAFEGSRRVRYPTPTVVAGKGEERGGGREAKFDFGTSAYKPAPIPMPSKGKEDAKVDDKSKLKDDAARAGGAKPADKSGDKKDDKKIENEDKDAATSYNTFSKKMFELSGIIEDNEKELSKGGDPDTPAEIQKAIKTSRDALFELKQLKRRITQKEKEKPTLKKGYNKAINDVMKDNKEYLDKVGKLISGPYKDDMIKINDKLKEIKEFIEKNFPKP